jgi:hypothetical protein
MKTEKTEETEINSLDSSPFEDLQRQIGWRLESQKVQLLIDLRSLASRLNRAADDLETGNGLLLNDLGEVQGQGSRLDVMCAKYRAYLEFGEGLKVVGTKMGIDGKVGPNGGKKP